NNSTYRAASIKPANTQLLYLFLRIYFSIIIPFLILLLIISSTKQWKLLAETRKFKDRLIDRFITASFLCLFVLVGVTFYILDRQNSTEVQDELLSRLNSFVQSIAIQDSASVADPEFLKTSSSILAEDVALFVDASLVNSTTPQIYSQHILPDVLPWTVFQNLTTTGSQQEIQIIQLNGQEMMIGYQPWLDANNKIVGVAAIPTFLRTPKFYEELLSTTSYLLAFFSIIFGLLMVSISVIASRMTSPLEALKLGLGKIASGDLEATLPVTSTDEIGMLTQAYNTMATRLKELQHELAESEREAAWKEMAQQVAHEIKNPLTPMKLNLQHLERQLSETEHQLEKTNPRIASITKSMIEQIEALNKIASDFSKFAKPIRKEFEVVDLNKLVSSVADLYEQELQIKVKSAPRKLFVYGVPDELRRVFVNLIKNAQEAIKEGGEIHIKAETDPAQHHALIHVTDTGKGISEEDQNKIFTPNFSTKTSGTGLGLAITKKIIEEHRGTISFSSEKNKATTFSVKIPLKLK
ncbi:MAG: ATP-binding protein, partial [Balneolales bacterium]|nr:ATP-binding protein [Balneolales bacterium]